MNDPILDFIHNRDYSLMEIHTVYEDIATTYIRMTMDDFITWCKHNNKFISGDQDSIHIRNKGTGIYRTFHKKDLFEWVHDNNWRPPMSRDRRVIVQVLP